jgi:hypothetical protein
MANNKSIYDVYFEAGASEGEYEASLSGIQDVWTGIESSRGDLAFDLARIGRTVDTLQAGTELISTVAGGAESRQDFQRKDLIGAQTEIAKQAYERITKGDATALSWDELEKSKRTDFMAEYTPIKVGAGGKLWSQYTKMEQLWEKPLYRFGGEDVSHAYSKTDVQGISQFAKYGTPKLDVFQTSLYGEATGRDVPVSPGVRQPTKYETLETSTADLDQMGGEPVYDEPSSVNTVIKQPDVSQNVVKNNITQNYKRNKVKTGEQLLKEFPYR